MARFPTPQQLSEAIWNYRGFILGSVKREFQSRYQNSLLGAAWAILNPLALITVYTVIFSSVMKARLPGIDDSLAYSIYLCSGMLTWGLFNEITSRSVSVFVDNADLMKKLAFPRLCLPLIVVLSSMANFTIIFTLFILFLLATGRLELGGLIALPLLIFLQVTFAAGLGMILGVLNVFFRDVGQFFGVVLQFWFWFTPIVYPVSVLPNEIAEWIAFNPMVPLMNAYQQIFLTGELPSPNTLRTLLISAIVALFIGLALFKRRSAEMVDEL